MQPGSHGGVLVLRPARPVQRWTPPSGRAAAMEPADLGRIWVVTEGGEAVVIGVRARPAGPEPTAPFLTGRLIDRDGPPRRRRPAALPAGRRAGPRHLGGSAVAGLAVAIVIVGVGLFVGTAEVATRPAAESQLPAALPSEPTMEFVYPILPAPALVPQAPTDLGLLFSAPVPGASVPVVPGPVVPGPVVVPGPGVPGPVVPVVPGPPPGPVAPPATTSTPPQGGSGGGGGGQTEGTGDDRAEQTKKPSTAPFTPSSSPKPPSSKPPSSKPSSSPPPPPSSPAPPSVLLFDLGPDPLLVGGADVPDVLDGPGLGLWSGGPVGRSVLVLGTKHPALTRLLNPDPPAEELVVVVIDDTWRVYVGERPVSHSRAAAAALLATTSATDAPIVLVLSIGPDTVIMMEARP